MKIIFTRLILTALIASSEAATFAGTSTLGPGFDGNLVRVVGDVSGQRFTMGGSVSVEADLEPGFFTLNSLKSVVDQPNISFSGTQQFTDPITFQTSTFSLNVTFSQVVTTISAAQVPVTAGSGGLDFSISSIASGSINLSGTYSITGPLSSVSQPFELDLSLVGRGISGTLSNIDYPNAFDLETSPLTVGFPLQNLPLIFSETVDGQNFEAGIGLVNFNSRGPVSLTVIPEPSALFLLLLGGTPLLLRRR